MRPSLLHPLAERRHARRHRRGRSSPKPAHGLAKPAHGLAEPAAAHLADPAVRVPNPAVHVADPAVQRVREAGGPIDRASYSCQCGFLFEATVSTSVECPHCGCSQAW